jgi:putative heme-binding domain-containing protein
MFRLSILTLAIAVVPAWGQGFKLAPGYEISEYADASLANDIISVAIDPKGRVVVSGPNYIRILVDDQKAGKANRAIEFAKEPKSGAHGMLWEGDTLYIVGDNGLRALVDQNGDGVADGPSKMIRVVKAGVEHGAHALRRGPDGWLYLIAGDQGGIDASYAELPTSPVKRPIAGCVVRFQPGTFKSEIVAHGFRNPYGFDFDALGRLFTFDSDNERCIGMPWYEANRFYMVVEGGFYGWLGPQFSTRLWRIPPYAPDVIAPLATFGRGSPTFVLSVGGKGTKTAGAEILLGDWTFGRIHRAVVPVDSLDRCKDTSVLLESTGSSGFAPTSAVVHPQTGDVYVAIGGRGTRGAVYRIRGGTPVQATRTRPALATEASADPNLDVARGAVDVDPLVRLRALERVARRQPSDKPALRDDVARAAIEANWENANRVIAYAASRAASDNAGLLFKREGKLRARRADFLSHIMDGQAFDPALILPLLDSDDDELVLDGLCLLQRRLDLPAEPSAAWEGYAGSVAEADRKTFTAPVARLIERLDRAPANLQREAARTFALIAAELPPTRVLAWLKASEHPTETLHLLAVLAHCGSLLADGETAVVADALLGLDRAYVKRDVPRETNWPIRFGELVPMLLKRDPKLAPALLAHVEFGAPEHAVLADAKGFPRGQAVPIFLKKIAADKNYALDGKVLSLLFDVPGAETPALLRPYWGKGGLDEPLLPFLARQPRADDRDKFVAGLKSLQPFTVENCLKALDALGLPADDDEVLNLLTAWDQAGEKQAALVRAIAGRLQRATAGDKAPLVSLDRAAWGAWVARRRPAVAKRLALVDNVDLGVWQKRLNAVDWKKGDINNGKAFFAKASCAACHSGPQANGPDLAGIATRFGRDDLFTAILQPNKEVADRYRVTQIVTNDGKVHRGLLVYNAFDGILVRTGVADMIRIPGSAIESRATVARSLMPAGLLDAATDADLADLYAYLKSLGPKAK